MFRRTGIIVCVILFGLIIGGQTFIATEAMIALLWLTKIIPATNIGNQLFFIFLYLLLLPAIEVTFVIVAIRVWKKRNIFYEIFKPTKQKLLINALVFILYIATTAAINKFMNLPVTKSIDFQTFTFYNHTAFNYLISYPQLFIYQYPFSAALYSLFRQKKKRSKLVLYLLLCILFFNPIIQAFGASNVALRIHQQSIKLDSSLFPCGVNIITVTKGGPADAAGLKPFEIIHSLNGIEIKTTTELLNYLDNIKEAQSITVATQLKTYIAMPTKDLRSGKYRMGISIEQGYCRR